MRKKIDFVAFELDLEPETFDVGISRVWKINVFARNPISHRIDSRCVCFIAYDETIKGFRIYGHEDEDHLLLDEKLGLIYKSEKEILLKEMDKAVPLEEVEKRTRGDSMSKMKFFILIGDEHVTEWTFRKPISEKKLEKIIKESWEKAKPLEETDTIDFDSVDKCIETEIKAKVEKLGIREVNTYNSMEELEELWKTKKEKRLRLIYKVPYA